MKAKLLRYVLMILISFQAISAVPAGLILIIDTTGEKLGLPIRMLNGTPFKDFLIPGLFLLILLGLFPILIVYGLLKKPNSKLADKMNLYKNQHWAWTFSYYLGLLLVVWINMQLFFIKDWGMLHFVYSMLGVLIIVVTLLPDVKSYYAMKSMS